MEDIKKPERITDKVDTPAVAEKPHKRRRVRLPKISKKAGKRLLIVAVIGLVLGGVYYAGVKKGESRSKAASSKLTSSTAKKANDTASNRWTSVGTVLEASADSIKVKDSRGETKQAKITKDTVVVDKKGTKLSAKDIKKDQRVIVSGTKDTKNNLTATRIRLQQ